jgi:O-glycosyl hydrolase
MSRTSRTLLVSLVLCFGLGITALIVARPPRPLLRVLQSAVWNWWYGNPAPPSAGFTTVQVHATVAHQTVEGFGANVQPLVMDGRDMLTPSLRQRALDAAYRQVALSMGMVDQMLVEARDGHPQNDNDDPRNIEWTGFQTSAVDALIPKLLQMPVMARLDNYHLGQRINTRWASPWLAQLRETDYSRYLEEAAEQIVAGCLYWRERVGAVPRWLQVFNEPLSGNHELKGAATGDLVDIVANAGERLQQKGFGRVRFVVASEETEEKSYESAAAILADSRARRYVGAIGYHPYPYGSAYANIPRLLRTSALGRPDTARVEARRRLRELARAYGVPLWMSEVSAGGVDPRSYEDFLGRAIHIHDELVYADASAFFGMLTMWDVSQPLHDAITPIGVHEGTVVLVDSKSNSVDITGIGYAIGHYARWIRRGALRVEAVAGDALLKVAAFRDDERRTLTIVLINNAGSSRTVRVTVDGIRLAENVRGEQSTRAAYWVPMATFSPETASSFAVEMAATSVMTIAAGVDPSPESARKLAN